jgi:glycosyltransferase involved in cell wall biosynthesis
MNLLAYIHLRRLPKCTGVGRMAGELAGRLAARDGLRLRILADRKDYERVSQDLSAGLRAVPMRFFSLETSWQQARWLLLHSPKAEDYWNDCDVVWCPAESYVPTKKARLAVTVHDVACFEPGFPFGTGRVLHRMKWNLLFRVLERHADAIITVSSFSADRVAHYFPGLTRRLHVVPHGVTERFREPVSACGEAEIERLGLKGKPFILVPGGLSWRKNAPLILAAWMSIRQELPAVELVVSGDSGGGWAKEAQGPGSSTKLLGYVSDDVLRSLYAEATVVWFPSRYEGFGIPVIEAMACGSPVVTTRAAAMPEVAGDGAVLLSPDRPGEHVEAILGLFRSKTLRDAYRQRAVTRSAPFTWQRAADKLVMVLKSL